MMSEDRLYADYLRGKRVVIVGPAPTLLGSNQGNLIDSFDVVVRIKKVLSKIENLRKDIGSRTDVLYSWFDPDPGNGGQINFQDLKNGNVAFVCCPYPEEAPFSRDNIKRFLNANSGRFHFHAVEKPFYDLVETRIQCRPNSGILAILDLLKHEISELYITGFTFFKGGYIKEYCSRTEKEAFQIMAMAKTHQQPPQMLLLKEHILKDNRTKIDGPLAKILGLENRKMI